MLTNSDLLICNGKGHFLLWIEDDDDLEPIAMYHEE